MYHSICEFHTAKFWDSQLIGGGTRSFNMSYFAADTLVLWVVGQIVQYPGKCVGHGVMGCEHDGAEGIQSYQCHPSPRRVKNTHLTCESGSFSSNFILISADKLDLTDFFKCRQVNSLFETKG